ncbi:MAG: hypothetical protein AAF656_07930 [Planctomycetota bacterium]
MANELAIVLCSGGGNALVTAALAAQRHRVVLIHAQRQEHPSPQLTAFEKQVEHFKPERAQTIVLPAAPPVEPAAALTDRCADLLPLLGVAGRLAAKADAAALYLGLRIGNDPANDLAAALEFTQLWGELLRHACGNTRCSVETPLIDLSVEQVSELAAQVDAPMALAAE